MAQTRQRFHLCRSIRGDDVGDSHHVAGHRSDLQASRPRKRSARERFAGADEIRRVTLFQPQRVPGRRPAGLREQLIVIAPNGRYGGYQDQSGDAYCCPCSRTMISFHNNLIRGWTEKGRVQEAALSSPHGFFLVASVSIIPFASRSRMRAIRTSRLISFPWRRRRQRNPPPLRAVLRPGL